MFCKYKDIFGKPKQGAHKYRLFNLAVVDVIGMIILILVFTKIFNINIITMSVLIIIITIVLHRLFCVNTTINHLIFGMV
jgi:hypothetical protein